MRDRAYRRWQMERAKQRVLRWLRRWRRWMRDGDEPPPDFVGRTATTPKMCSCPGCGNERRHFGHVTRQEKQQAEREAAQD